MSIGAPADVGNQAAPAAAPRAAVSSSERSATPLRDTVPALDRADIKPLDVAAALQILIAEVREALQHTLSRASDTAEASSTYKAGSTFNAGSVPPSNVDNPTGVARIVAEIVLQSLPDIPDATAWGESLARVEAALETGMQRAIDAVSSWRDVAPAVVETTKQSVALARQVIGAEPQNPLWLRAEWLEMAPRFGRVWRRRRAYRRHLSDPDDTTLVKGEEADGTA